MARLNVIGCGTGRSGTMSLAQVIGRCRGIVCTHEVRPLLPWEYDAKRYRRRLDDYLQSPDGSADVYFGYLPHLRRFFLDIADLKVLCVERARDEVVDSYMRWTGNANHWMEHDGTTWAYNWWDRCYPKFPATSKDEAIGMYWDHYYSEIRKIQAEHPSDVLIVPTESLNTDEGRHQIFDFLEIEEADRYHPIATVHHQGFK